MPPRNLPTGQGTPTQPVSINPVIRTMLKDQETAMRGGSVSGSGKVFWPSVSAPAQPQVAPRTQTTPVATPTRPASPDPVKQGGFLASLLSKSKKEQPAQAAPMPAASAVPTQKASIAVNAMPSAPASSASKPASMWEARVPSVERQESFLKGETLPKPAQRSALPLPQKPGGAPAAAIPPSQQVATPRVPLVAPPPIASRPLQPVAPRPVSAAASEPAHVPLPKVGQVMQPSPTPPARIKAPEAPKAAAPLVHPLSANAKPTDDDFGIDLGISDYLKGGPTFQISRTQSPIPSQPMPSTPPVVQAPASMQTPVARVMTPPVGLRPQTGTPGGVWNPAPAPARAPVAITPMRQMPPAPQPTPVAYDPNASIFTPTPRAASAQTMAQPAPVAPQPAPAPAAPAPLASNADLHTEKDRLEAERAEIAGKRSAVESSVMRLLGEKQQIENELRPLAERESAAIRAVDELERREAGLQGEQRRGVERERWTKTEERRKVEQEKMLVKRKLADAENMIHSKEDEQAFLVKREKEIDGRIEWLSKETERREVRAKLAEVRKEKATVEGHRGILDNSLKRLKASIEEAEKNERRLAEEKRTLLAKTPANFAEEEQMANARYDIEKQMHEVEVRRWSIEDELRSATELFAKEDMAYLDVSRRVDEVETKLKALG